MQSYVSRELHHTLAIGVLLRHPVSQLGVHTRKYGRFGLSFPRGPGGPLQGRALLRGIKALHEAADDARTGSGGTRLVGAKPQTPQAIVDATLSMLETRMRTISTWSANGASSTSSASASRTCRASS